MAIHKVVFILGAGASRSISRDIPVMADFFEKCLPYLENPKEHSAIWLAFTILEESRCFLVSNRQLENAAAYAMAMHWHLSDLKNKRGIAEDSPEYKDTERSCLEWIQHYRKLCEKEESRIHANLEVVFAEAEKKLFEARKRGDLRGNFAYLRLVWAVQYLFSDLFQRFRNAEAHAELSRLLSEWLNADSSRSATFISFNYDVWLERSLQEVGVWHPHRGYQYEFKRFANLDNALQASAQWDAVFANPGHVIDVSKTFKPQPFTGNPHHKVYVLKPHGSLSWFVEEESSDCLVLLENTEDSQVTVLPHRWYLRDQVDETGRDTSTYEPFIVPPTQLKRRQHPIFWQIDHRIFQVLSEADAIVSIGWSMPETDRDFQQKITHAMEHRPHGQLKRFVICNYDPGEKDLGFYLRMESVFRPAKKTEIFGDGFVIDSIKKVFGLLREGEPEPVRLTESSS